MSLTTHSLPQIFPPIAPRRSVVRAFYRRHTRSLSWLLATLIAMTCWVGLIAGAMRVATMIG